MSIFMDVLLKEINGFSIWGVGFYSADTDEFDVSYYRAQTHASRINDLSSRVNSLPNLQTLFENDEEIQDKLINAARAALEDECHERLELIKEEENFIKSLSLEQSIILSRIIDKARAEGK